MSAMSMLSWGTRGPKDGAMLSKAQGNLINNITTLGNKQILTQYYIMRFLYFACAFYPNANSKTQMKRNIVFYIFH